MSANLMIEIFVLLLTFQIKHFLADYPLQTPFMFGKFKPDWDFFLPLVTHCGMHAFFTFWICLIYMMATSPLTYMDVLLVLSLSFFDFVIHFIMDRVKAGPKYLGRFKALPAYEVKGLLAQVSLHEKGIMKNEELTKKQKARLNRNKYFWWSLGLDQSIHHLTHYAIIYMLVS